MLVATMLATATTSIAVMSAAPALRALDGGLCNRCVTLTQDLEYAPHRAHAGIFEFQRNFHSAWPGPHY